MNFKETLLAEIKAARPPETRGRKPMQEGDRKQTVNIFPTNSQVEAMGGREAVQEFCIRQIENYLKQ